MLTAAITLLALGLLLMALAVRGRVVARGRFCRRCRFDLAGLGAEQGACPECGRDLNGPNAVRPVRRRASRPGIALAAGLLILGGATTTTALPGVGAWVAGRLTDRQVLALSEHWDRALLELVSRTAVPASKLPQEVWRDAVERGLAHQGDLDAPWDPRWGAVLLHASFADDVARAGRPLRAPGGRV